MLGGEAVRQEVPDDRRRGRGVGGGLYHGAVPRGDRPDEGPHGEEEGVVPGGHHQDHPVGLLDDGAPGGELGQGGAAAPVPHPAGQVLLRIAQLGQDHPHLAQIALGGGLVQVGLEGGADVPLPGRDSLSQPLQGRPAGGQREGGPGIEIGPLGRHKGLDVHRLPPVDP